MEIEMVYIRSSTERSLNPCCPNGIWEKMTQIFYSHTSFLMPKKDETFLRHHNVKIKIMSYFISINYFMMLWTGRIKFKFQGLS